MRKYIVISLCIFLTRSLVAQQIPLGNLYNSNEYLINSAESAVDTIPVIFLSHRQQWLKIPGLPITNMINGHTHINENAAFGFKLFNDKLGLMNQYFGMVSFAHRFMFTPKNGFAIGLSAGYYQNTINFDDAIVNDGSDNVLANGKLSGSTFESSASLMLVLDHFKLGVSVPRLVEQNINNSNNSLNDFVLRRHVMTYSRFHYDINNNLFLEPSVLWKIFPVTGQSQFEGNLDMYINNMYTVGAGYRQGEAIMLRASVKPHKYLQIAYSYEFFTNGYTQFSSGSHEIRVGIFFNRKKKEEPPLKPVEPKPRYKYEALPTEDAIILHLAESSPGLSETLKELTDRDDFSLSTNEEDRSYEIEITSKKDHLQKRKFKFKTLNELREFAYKLKEQDPTLQGDLENIIDNNDIIKYEDEFQYKELASEDEILLKMARTKPPGPSDNLKSLTDRDDVELKYTKEGYSLDIGDESEKKRFSFRTLDEINEFALKLNNKNPGLKDDLLNIIGDDGELRDYENKKFKYVKLNPNEELLVKLGRMSPTLSADIRKLSDNRDDVELVLEDDRTYSLIIGKDFDKRKFRFQTLGQMNAFMRKIKFTDKTLTEDPIPVIDNDPYLRRFEDEHFVFKRLKASHELMLDIQPKNPGLTDNLKSLMEDRTDMVFSVDKYDRYEVELTDEVTKEKKVFKFETLDELNSFTLKLRSANPDVEDNLKELTDNLGLQYEDKSYTKEELETLRAILRFEIGTSTLTSYSRRIMDEKIAIVKEKPFKKLVIAGYTCDIGSDQLNRKLSKQRAQKIANYFIKAGIPAEKLEVHGMGPDYPLVPNTTDENRRKNRRVEFEVYF